MQVSGLEEELELAQDLPRLRYAKVPAPDREPRLEELISRIRQETSYRKFETSDELRALVRGELATLLSERFAANRGPTPGPGSARWRPRSLPSRTTSLGGRERDIDEVARLIQMPDVRLVTLTGPGGRQDRLAVAVGERLGDRFSDGTATARRPRAGRDVAGKAPTPSRHADSRSPRGRG